MTELNVTREMVRDGVEQSRVDSSLSMTADERVYRIIRAALTGAVDRKPLHETSPPNTCM